MLVLLLIAFVSGLLTIFAPCIWPILPVVLSSSVTGGKARPLGITTGVLLSFTIFTLSLSYLVRAFGFDPDSLRLLAVIVIAFLGLTLLIPPLGAIFEGLASRLTGKFSSRISSGHGFWSGLLTGSALGIVWSPCAGPILATIAALSATRAVNSQVILVTLAYMIGTGIPLFLFATFGSRFIQKSRSFSPYIGVIQKIFGVIMIVTAVLIWTNYDKLLQAKLLDAFPGYSSFLYELEQTNQIQQQLNRLSGREVGETVTVDSYLPDMGKAAEIIGIENWLNSDPLTIESLKGKVVLIDFWTYSCINCIRTLPYLTSWYEKYQDQGLVIIGVHTPEFEFEKKTENVSNAIEMFGINYPVAQDNDYRTWNNFRNIYWPAKYLIDKDGRLRYKHFGEGKYKETEMAIQSLLAETGMFMPTDTVSLSDETPTMRLTPETYLGLNRLARFASNERPRTGEFNYTSPDSVASDNFAYAGTWELAGEHGESKGSSELILNFFANKVFLVITPAGSEDSVKVYLDGNLVTDQNAGKDVENGEVRIDTSRLYELIDLKGDYGRHELKLEFGTEGTQIFAFTFG